MLTRTRLNRSRSLSLALGLLAGLSSLSAAAVEEITARATPVAAPPTQSPTLPAGFTPRESATVRAELKEYLEALNRQLKEQLDADLKKQPPSIKLVLSEIPSRG